MGSTGRKTNQALSKILATVEAGNGVGRPLDAVENVFAIADQSRFDPFGQQFQEIADGAVVEAPFVFFQDQMEVAFRNVVAAAQAALALASEVPDAVDVVAAINEFIAMVDALVAEFGQVKNISGFPVLRRRCHRR